MPKQIPQEKIDKARGLRKQGMSLEKACAATGISTSSFYRKDKGKSEESPIRKPAKKVTKPKIVALPAQLPPSSKLMLLVGSPGDILDVMGSLR